MDKKTAEEVKKLVGYLEKGERVGHSLSRLRHLEFSAEISRQMKLKKIAERFLNSLEFSENARLLVDKIRGMEEGKMEKYDGKNPSKVEIHQNPPVNPYRQRKRPSSAILALQKLIPDGPPDLLTPVERPFGPQNSSVQLIDVSKMRNMSECEYEWLRPTLTQLSSKSLKSFMDRNPEMEEIGDGLFRRHCQIDCPRAVQLKRTGEKWRTIHDVHTNWDMFQQARRWERHLVDDLNRAIRENQQGTSSKSGQSSQCFDYLRDFSIWETQIS